MVLVHTFSPSSRVFCPLNTKFSRQVPLFFCTLKTMVGEKNHVLGAQDSVTREVSSDVYSNQRKLKEKSDSPYLVKGFSCLSIEDQTFNSGGSGGYKPVSRAKAYKGPNCLPSAMCAARIGRISQSIQPHCGKTFQEKEGSNRLVHPEWSSQVYTSGSQIERRPPQSATPVKLNRSLYDQNKEKRREFERPKNGSHCLELQSGMVLLKNYITHDDQVEILRKCEELGSGHGGFYQPGYRNGGKLHLRMMCLGKNWDPESRLYGDTRSIDGAKPPSIDDKFKDLVRGAIQDAHVKLRQKARVNAGVDILPTMTPDICIVNFYTDHGKLGLHQDRDESTGSIERGLPVVSFSIGDSAEFLYGMDRDKDRAKKIMLESGDVLIFGGESRLIFHGVSCIYQNTAPKWLLDSSKFLLPGRLNLTFRQY